MEMDYVTGFAHSHMDRRPTKRPRLAWENPQAHSKVHFIFLKKKMIWIVIEDLFVSLG